MTARRWLLRLGVLALFLAIWEAAFRLGLLSPIIFGSPSLIVKAAAGGGGWTVFPGSPTGEEAGEVDPEAELGLALEPDLGFCAQGGRSGLSWVKAIPAKRSAQAARSKAGRGQKAMCGIDIRMLVLPRGSPQGPEEVRRRPRRRHPRSIPFSRWGRCA